MPSNIQSYLSVPQHHALANDTAKVYPHFQGILRCILAIFLGSFLFCLHIFIGNIFKGFCFYHVNTFRCFDYEIRFIAFGSICPIYVELVRCWSQPPQYIIIRLQHIRKIELVCCRTYTPYNTISRNR